MPSLQNTSLTETGAIINLEIPVSTLRGQAEHVISARPGNEHKGDAAGFAPPKPPDAATIPNFSPRLLEPEYGEEGATESDQAAGKDQDGVKARPDGGDPGGTGTIVPYAEHLKVDMSHILTQHTTIRRLLTECIDPEIVDDLIRGAKIIKHNAAGGTATRRIYLNFDDGTLRVQHTYPLIQSFMSDQHKGVYFLFKCYMASPWDQSARGKERMFKNKAYAKPDMKSTTLSLVMRGRGEALVATFANQEEYNKWLLALNTLQRCTNMYFSFFAERLLKASSKMSVGRLERSRGVWAALINLRRTTEKNRSIEKRMKRKR